MATFFDPAFLEMYIGTKLEQYGGDIDTTKYVTEMLESEEFDKKLDVKLEDLGWSLEIAIHAWGPAFTCSALLAGKSEAFAPVMAMGMDAVNSYFDS